MNSSIPPGLNPPKDIYVRVEIPLGSKVKYEFNERFNSIVVDRILHSSVVYPAAYGYIPQTLCEDGDHLDVLLLLSTGIELMPGCIILARPVALLRMRDEEGEDNKVIAVPIKDPRMNEITSLKSIPKHLLREIENFFDTYKHLEPDKTTELLGWADKQDAFEEINKGISLYLGND